MAILDLLRREARIGKIGRVGRETRKRLFIKYLHLGDAENLFCVFGVRTGARKAERQTAASASGRGWQAV